MAARVLSRLCYLNRGSGRFPVGRARGKHQRLQHLESRTVLDERGDAEVFPVGAGQDRKRAALLELPGVAERERTDPLTHHEVVLEALALVLAGLHVAREAVLVRREVDGGVLAAG